MLHDTFIKLDPLTTDDQYFVDTNFLNSNVCGNVLKFYMLSSYIISNYTPTLYVAGYIVRIIARLAM